MTEPRDWSEFDFQVYNKDPMMIRATGPPPESEVYVFAVDTEMIRRYKTIEASAGDHEDLVALIVAGLRELLQ